MAIADLEVELKKGGLFTLFKKVIKPCEMNTPLVKFLTYLTFCLLVFGCKRESSNVSSEVYQNGERVLANGVVLPEIWPPDYPENEVRKKMNVPYLEERPNLIPINIGRQLFVDSFLIEETDLKTKYYQAEYYEGNPILEPTEKWERSLENAPYAAPFSDGVWYDEKFKKFRMWYLAAAASIHNKKNSFYTCYAESDDGIRWTKINQDIIKGTNIVDTMNRDASTMWIDRIEKDKNKRYKKIDVRRSTLNLRQYVLKYSEDGIHWSDGVAQSGDIFDRSTVYYNPYLEKWIFSIKHSGLTGRSRIYLEHENLEEGVSLAHKIYPGSKDLHLRYWFSADDEDPHHPDFPNIKPEIYNHDAIAYENLFIGYFSIWQGPENHDASKLQIQKRNEILLGFSRDGFHWDRPNHTPFMGVDQSDGAWNWGNVQSVVGSPIIVGDSLYFYSSGRRINKWLWDGYTSTGLAKLRRDGFASVSGTGYLTTRPLVFDNAKFLFVNAEVKGKLDVELLDEDGKVFEGFSKEDCISFNGNETKNMIMWKDGRNISSLNGKRFRVKFYLQNGNIYSFWVSSWETGESKGYTAGGGPDISPTGQDVPIK